MWSWPQIAASAQPISRCETDRLWPHRSSTDMNDSRAAFYLLRRSSRFWFSGCVIEFTIAKSYRSHPPSQGAGVQRRPRTTCLNWEFSTLRSVNYDKCTRDRPWEDDWLRTHHINRRFLMWCGYISTWGLKCPLNEFSSTLLKEKLPNLIFLEASCQARAFLGFPSWDHFKDLASLDSLCFNSFLILWMKQLVNMHH